MKLTLSKYEHLFLLSLIPEIWSFTITKNTLILRILKNIIS